MYAAKKAAAHGIGTMPGLSGPNYGMLGGSSGLMNPYPGMLPGQDPLAHMGMGATFDLTAYNPQLVSISHF